MCQEKDMCNHEIERSYDDPSFEEGYSYFEESCNICGTVMVHGVEYEDGMEDLWVL